MPFPYSKKLTGSFPEQNDAKTVAVLGQTNIDWVISTFAISKAGYTVMILSPRLSSVAIAKLLRETRCECLIHSGTPPVLALVRETTAAIDIQTMLMLPRAEYDKLDKSLQQFPEDPNQEKRTAVILHSSGSTGLPKSISIPHARLVAPTPIPGEKRDLITLPLLVSTVILPSIKADSASHISFIRPWDDAHTDVPAHNTIFS